MKKLIIYVALTVTLISMYSCSKEDSINPDKRDPKVILFMGEDAANQTKTTLEGFVTKWIADRDSIGIFSDEACLNQLQISGVNNFPMCSKTSEKRSPFYGIGGEIYWGTSSTHNFYAYYPYQSGVFTSGEVPVTLPMYQVQRGCTNSHIGDLDVLIATPKSVTTPQTEGEQTSVNFSFNHLYTILEFQIKLTTGTAKLGGIEITADTGNLSLTSGTIDIKQTHPGLGNPYQLNNVSGNNRVNLEIKGECIITSDYQTTASAYMVILPGDLSGSENIEIKITTDKGVMRVKKNGINFKRGSMYKVQVSDPEIVITPLDLSSYPSNCYMVQPNHSYTIRGDVRGNGVVPQGTYAPTYQSSLSPVSLRVIWESNRDVILSSPVLTGSSITFSTGRSYGNALIAAFDGENGEGNILWSWHIWSISGGAVFQADSKDMMPYNLGAMNNVVGDLSSLGLLYQWGRKDPLLNAVDWGSDIPMQHYGDNFANQYTAESLSAPGNITQSIQNPFSFLEPHIHNATSDWYITSLETSHNEQNYSSLWSKDLKTMFDPCPFGWRVPPSSVWLEDLEMWGVYNNRGRVYLPTGSWYPASGIIATTGSIGSSGIFGSYWTCEAPYTLGSPHKAVVLIFTDIGVSITEDARGTASSVRCVKN